MAGVIEAYLSQLDRRLAFDAALSARVRDEVQDHLLEAVEAAPDLPRDVAEARAVQRFGTAREVAARFAADALTAQSNRTWLALAAAAGAAFLAMRLRRMVLEDGAFEAAPVAALVDRYAFIAAIAVAAIGFVAFRARRHESLWRFRIAGAAATASCAALVASIAGGAVIALAHQPSLPTLSALLLECAMAMWLATHVWRLQQGTRVIDRALRG